MAVGLVLDTVTRGRGEMKLLAYLHIALQTRNIGRPEFIPALPAHDNVTHARSEAMYDLPPGLRDEHGGEMRILATIGALR